MSKFNTEKKYAEREKKLKYKNVMCPMEKRY